MKARFTVLIALTVAFFYSHAQAGQLPNANFNTWDSVYNPTDWSTYESIFQEPINHTFRDTDNIDNSFAVKLVSDSSDLAKSYGVFAGRLSLGPGVFINDTTIGFPGIPFAYRPDKLLFDYKYQTPGPDTAEVVIQFSKLHSFILSGIVKMDTTSVWLTETITLTSYYTSGDDPDTFKLSFFSSTIHPVRGSTLWLDNVRLVYNNPIGINEVTDPLAITIYPNPAFDKFTIASAHDLSGFRLTISDITGQLVSSKILAGKNALVDIGTLTNGNYLYRITDEHGLTVKQDKLMVIK